MLNSKIKKKLEFKQKRKKDKIGFRLVDGQQYLNQLRAIIEEMEKKDVQKTNQFPS